MAGPPAPPGVLRVGARAPEEVAVGFVAALRARDVVVPVGSSLLYARALGEVGLGDPDGVYWAGRATLLRRPEDIPAYDEAFAAYWRQREVSVLQEVPDEVTLLVDDPDAPDEDGDGEGEGDDVQTVRWSTAEILAVKDFAAYTAEELEEARRLMAQMRLSGSPRRSRRRVTSRRERGRPDLRRTVRRAMRTGGEPVRRIHTEPGERPRRLVLLLDVSGSMEAYARALLRFVHAAVVGRGRVEAFTLGTRLTRLTRELSDRDPDAAIRKATGATPDWSGGTRLGDTLRAFNDEWGQRGMARGAIVVILSDGWDRGDPEVMAEQMARLSRVAHRVVWVNPLKASEGYAPLARGMAAALPFVDDFIEGHSLDALGHLASVIMDGTGPGVGGREAR
jgi:uncharacterized protein with von Willebrand factor type A (vWA) domain